MNTPTINDTGRSVFSGSVWFQERYFLAALQEEVERARQIGTALAIVIVRVPECTRRAAHHLFLYAEAETSTFFYGLLSSGDYVVCMPGYGFTEAAMERTMLAHALSGFDVSSGLAVLDEEQTAAELIGVALRDCDIAVRDHFGSITQRAACYGSLRRLRDH